MSLPKHFKSWFFGHGHCAPNSGTRLAQKMRMSDYDRSTFMMFYSLEGIICDMAKQSRGKAPRVFDIEFVNVTLNESQRKDFKAWYATSFESLADEIGQVMVDDYRVSCNWDDNNQCFIATFTGKTDNRANPSRALSSRADNWFEALGINLFKHTVLFKSGEWDGEGVKNNWG